MGLFLVIVLYFFPTVCALANSGAGWSEKFAAFSVNLMFGWTIIGWFLALSYGSANHKAEARIAKAKANFYLREEEKHNAMKAPV